MNKDNYIKQLCQAFISINSLEEGYNFFNDLCTVGEIKALAQRLEVAKMLNAGNTYDEIVDTTGASTATISRVKRSLYYGSGGYKTVLEKLK